PAGEQMWPCHQHGEQGSRLKQLRRPARARPGPPPRRSLPASRWSRSSSTVLSRATRSPQRLLNVDGLDGNRQTHATLALAAGVRPEQAARTLDRMTTARCPYGVLGTLTATHLEQPLRRPD